LAALSSATSSSATWTALSAAPLRRLSLDRKSASPFSTVSSTRMRPTNEASRPAACSGVGISESSTPGAAASSSYARSTLIGRANRALTWIEWPEKTGTRTQVPDTLRSGISRILRDSLRSFCSSSVSKLPSSTIFPASGSTLKAIGRA
jgi:hypothetical protein